MIIIGTGAQAKYAFDILELTHRYVNRVFNLPTYKEDGSKLFYKKEVLQYDINQIDEDQEVIICCSDNFLKEKIYKEVSIKNLVFTKVIHPKSTISTFATVNQGVIINANAVIQPGANVGAFCMIHSGVIIEHDCLIERFVNLAPGVTLAGGVTVGKYSTIYTGSIIGPNVTIGKGCIIGAGSLILKDVSDDTKIFGHPATLS